MGKTKKVVKIPSDKYEWKSPKYSKFADKNDKYKNITKIKEKLIKKTKNYAKSRSQNKWKRKERIINNYGTQRGGVYNIFKHWNNMYNFNKLIKNLNKEEKVIKTILGSYKAQANTFKGLAELKKNKSTDYILNLRKSIIIEISENSNKANFIKDHDLGMSENRRIKLLGEINKIDTKLIKQTPKFDKFNKKFVKDSKKFLKLVGKLSEGKLADFQATIQADKIHYDEIKSHSKEGLSKEDKRDFKRYKRHESDFKKILSLNEVYIQKNQSTVHEINEILDNATHYKEEIDINLEKQSSTKENLLKQWEKIYREIYVVLKRILDTINFTIEEMKKTSTLSDSMVAIVGSIYDFSKKKIPSYDSVLELRNKILIIFEFLDATKLNILEIKKNFLSEKLSSEVYIDSNQIEVAFETIYDILKEYQKVFTHIDRSQLGGSNAGATATSVGVVVADPTKLGAVVATPAVVSTATPAVVSATPAVVSTATPAVVSATPAVVSATPAVVAATPGVGIGTAATQGVGIGTAATPEVVVTAATPGVGIVDTKPIGVGTDATPKVGVGTSATPGILDTKPGVVTSKLPGESGGLAVTPGGLLPTHGIKYTNTNNTKNNSSSKILSKKIQNLQNAFTLKSHTIKIYPVFYEKSNSNEPNTFTNIIKNKNSNDTILFIYCSSLENFINNNNGKSNAIDNEFINEMNKYRKAYYISKSDKNNGSESSSRRSSVDSEYSNNSSSSLIQGGGSNDHGTEINNNEKIVSLCIPVFEKSKDVIEFQKIKNIDISPYRSINIKDIKTTDNVDYIIECAFINILNFIEENANKINKIYFLTTKDKIGGSSYNINLKGFNKHKTLTPEYYKNMNKLFDILINEIIKKNKENNVLIEPVWNNNGIQINEDIKDKNLESTIKLEDKNNIINAIKNITDKSELINKLNNFGLNGSEIVSDIEQKYGVSDVPQIIDIISNRKYLDQIKIITSSIDKNKDIAKPNKFDPLQNILQDIKALGATKDHKYLEKIKKMTTNCNDIKAIIDSILNSNFNKLASDVQALTMLLIELRAIEPNVINTKIKEPEKLATKFSWILEPVSIVSGNQQLSGSDALNKLIEKNKLASAKYKSYISVSSDEEDKLINELLRYSSSDKTHINSILRNSNIATKLMAPENIEKFLDSIKNKFDMNREHDRKELCNKYNSIHDFAGHTSVIENIFKQKYEKYECEKYKDKFDDKYKDGQNDQRYQKYRRSCESKGRTPKGYDKWKSTGRDDQC